MRRDVPLHRSLLGPAGPRQRVGALLLALGSAGTVGAALLFEHVGGYMPCALCLEERLPYYAATLVALAALLAALSRLPPFATRGLLLLVALLMLVSLGLGTYHAGVEWHWWAGPSGCTAGGSVDLSGDLLSTIDRVTPPACDQAAGTFLGLSFAGWNVVASLILLALALAAAFGRVSPRSG